MNLNFMRLSQNFSRLWIYNIIDYEKQETL